MPDLSIHISKDMLEKLKKVANKENISISKWVKGQLEKILQEEYPSDYFDSLSNTDKNQK